jgi:hypothetical protein
MNCPFCGVGTDAPHESQMACIDALNVEIRRMRALLQHLRPPIDSSSAKKTDAPAGPHEPSS